MAEYIEREALKEHLMSYAGMFTDELGFVVGLDAVLRGIDFQPAADVVPVVRCKDCKHRVLSGATPFMYYSCCDDNGLSGALGDYTFCSYGERRVDNG